MEYQAWDFETVCIVAATVIIHLIGIGLFLAWYAAGRPMSKAELQRWWKGVRFFPEWTRNHKRSIGQRCW